MPAHARLHLYQNQAKMEETRWRGSFPIRVPVQPEDKPHLFLGNEELPPVTLIPSSSQTAEYIHPSQHPCPWRRQGVDQESRSFQPETQDSPFSSHSQAADDLKQPFIFGHRWGISEVEVLGTESFKNMLDVGVPLWFSRSKPDQYPSGCGFDPLPLSVG